MSERTSEDLSYFTSSMVTYGHVAPEPHEAPEGRWYVAFDFIIDDVVHDPSRALRTGEVIRISAWSDSQTLADSYLADEGLLDGDVHGVGMSGGMVMPTVAKILGPPGQFRFGSAACTDPQQVAFEMLASEVGRPADLDLYLDYMAAAEEQARCACSVLLADIYSAIAFEIGTDPEGG
jgi:hypothetical protein